jgi:rhodanese-related sulfurtransferase
VPELERRLKEMGLGKEATIILICRSGDRSSKAQDRLQVAGYHKVFGIAEGFEGDTAKGGSKDGQRAVNGWKNANLPWTYKLDKAKDVLSALIFVRPGKARQSCPWWAFFGFQLCRYSGDL